MSKRFTSQDVQNLINEYNISEYKAVLYLRLKYKESINSLRPGETVPVLKKKVIVTQEQIDEVSEVEQVSKEQAHRRIKTRLNAGKEYNDTTKDRPTLKYGSEEEVLFVMRKHQVNRTRALAIIRSRKLRKTPVQEIKITGYMVYTKESGKWEMLPDLVD